MSSSSLKIDFYQTRCKSSSSFFRKKLRSTGKLSLSQSNLQNGSDGSELELELELTSEDETEDGEESVSITVDKFKKVNSPYPKSSDDSGNIADTEYSLSGSLNGTGNGNENAFLHAEEQSEFLGKSNDDTLTIAKKYLPSELIASLNTMMERQDNEFVDNEFFHSNINRNNSGITDKMRDEILFNNYNYNNSNSNNNGNDNGNSNGNDLQGNGTKSLNNEIIKINDFTPSKFELMFREELDDDKVVPLSNAIFKNGNNLLSIMDLPHEQPINLSDTKESNDINNNGKMVTIDSNRKHSIKNFFKHWRKPIVSYSAEIENRVFSPNSHRPTLIDVPGIDEVEQQQDDLDYIIDERRQRSSSTLNSLFSPRTIQSTINDSKKDNDSKKHNDNDNDNDNDDDNDNESNKDKDKDDIDESNLTRFFKSFTLRRKSPSLHVRFLSPITSP